MKLLLCNPRGFCAGVVRAIATVEKALELWQPPIYVKHQIVHNRHVVDRLKKLGAIFIEDLNKIPENSHLIFSAHGVSPKVRQQAKKRNLICIDATCGLVTKIHSATKRYAEKGYHILIIGHKNHVEVIGAMEEAPNQTSIIENVEDVNNLSFSKDQKLFYLTQTTLSLDDISIIKEALIKKYPHIQTLPSSSICYATTNRQLALRKILDEVDVVFVIGDPASSNSNRLCEVATNRQIKAYLINSPEEINKSQLENVKVIGLTAGASTPEKIVQQCVDHLKYFGVTEVEEVKAEKEEVFFQLPKEVLSP